MQRLLEHIAATAEMMGQTISPTAAAMMVNDLAAYRTDDVLAALKLVRAGASRFNLKAIIDALEKVCPDGRPGVEEAWAMIPKDEYGSVVMTQEMAEALHIAQPLLNAGDKIAARMSFREAYNRIMDANKRNGIKPSWFPSLGQDKEGRASVLAEAVRLGRIGAEQAAGILPPAQSAELLNGHGVMPAINDRRETGHEQAADNFVQIKQMLIGSRIGSAA